MKIAIESDPNPSLVNPNGMARHVLVFAPHPEDGVFGCGGTLRLLATAGARISVVIIGDGAADGNPDDLLEQREKESRAATQVLGCSPPTFWRLADRGMSYGETLVTRMLSAMESMEADLVFAPAITEIHPDHQAVAMAAAEALRRLGGQRRLALYEISAPLVPNMLVDISAVEASKFEAMNCFPSQLAERPDANGIAALNRYRACQLSPDVMAAEAFVIADAVGLGNGFAPLFEPALHKRHRLGFAIDGADIPLVSVIIRSMDRPTLTEALDSLALQTYSNIEVVLVNAKGPEHRQVEQWCGRFPVRMISAGERLPRSRAANTGLDAAHGEYVAFLDDDDWFEPDHIHKLMAAIEQRPEFRVVYSGVRCIDETNKQLPDTFLSPFDATRLLAENYIPFHAALFSKTLLALGCRIDESMDMYEDWDFWIQLSKFTDFQFVDGTSAVYRINRRSGSGVNVDSPRRIVAMLALYKKWHGELSDDQIIAVMQPIRQIPIKDRQIFSLHQAVAERDAQIGNLNQTAELNQIASVNQIASLNQAVVERDAQVANLNQAVAEREVLIADLNQTVAQTIAERDERIADINQASAERATQAASLNEAHIAKLNEAHIAALGQIASEREAAKATVQELLHSRSWRLTKPLRRLGMSARRMVGPRARCGIFSRVVMAVCLLPATFFHYRGLRQWAAAARHGASFFGAVLDSPAQSRARLAGMPRLVRVPVSMGVAVAQRIRKNRGVLPSALNMCRIFANEGLGGVRARMVVRVPERDAVVERDTAVVSAPVNPRRILVADYRIPMQEVSAGERGTVGILRDLCSLGFEVVFLPNDLAPSPRHEAELHALGVTVITRDQGHDSPAHYLSIQGHTFGAFYLVRFEVAECLLDAVRKAAPAARVILHTVDLHFLREAREAEVQDSDAARTKASRTRERELSIMRRVDQVVLVSSAEVPFLKEYLPDVPVSVFPALYAPIAIDPAPFEARRNIFFLGGFTHKPNVDAVQWFTGEIWPLVRARLPNVEFHIIGSEMPQSVLELARIPGLKVVGFVPDLDPILATMRMGVAPLRFGAGIKGKVAATMGAGVPCVCTGIAAEGMNIRDGVHTLLADEPSAFAEAVIKLYTDRELWTRLSAAGRELISRGFGGEANRSSLLSMLNAARALPISLFCEYCTARPPRAVPVPPEGALVDVTIIVPVYNQWKLTKACLNSILETCMGDGICFEIILADDGSSDETVRAAELYSGLKVVRTESNVGFLRNCNNAARHARGRYLLLLNNDTVVLPGWLSSLYLTMEQDESAAIAGSKLIYPDGVLQEAGGVLFNDGTALNVGRGQEGRDTPVFNIARETDYISGASIMVRRSFWERVGGFDERYKGAYCEDVDIAMSARSLGMQVVYQPASEVVHFEHQTYADARTHNKGLQGHNTDLLREKWRDVLQRDHLPVAPWHIAMANAERAVPASARKRRMQGRLNVLYFSPFPSHPASHGNRAITNQLARHFQSMGHTVHFVLLQSNEYTENDREEMRAAWDTLDVIPYSHSMLANGEPIPFDGWYEEGLGERIRFLCAQYDIDVVFCSYIFQSKLLEFVPSYMLKVIDAQDKMAERYEMLRANGQPLEYFSCTLEEEGAYLRRADLVVALREEDARYFDSVTGRHTAVVITHAEAPSFIGKGFTNVRHVGMVASANNINLTLMRECLGAIESHLHGADCPFTVHVAGQVKEMVGRLPDKESAVFRKPWVRMHGYVRDINRFYADMDIILSPVTMGTGINIKTVHAMAYGMPLLTTVCGSKGIETDDPMHVHTNLGALAASLFSIAEHPDELRRLAALSRDRYVRFYDESVKAVTALFASPKLIAKKIESRGSSVDSNCSNGGSKIEQMHFHPGVLDYQKDTLLKLMEMGGITSLRGKDVMEIGGNGDMAVGKTLVNWTGKKIIVVTPDPELQQEVRDDPELQRKVLDDHGIELLLRGAEDTLLPDSSFDLIYGCAILEHVLEYERMFRECFRLLKPGGHLLLQGGPHWYSRFGHHVFVVNAEMDYRFIGNNPVPDFGHLYLNKQEMDAELSGRRIPPSHREAIIRQIYDDTSLNRAYLEDILKAFRSLPWNDIEIRTEGDSQPGAGILSRIYALEGRAESRIFADNLYMAARKHA